MLKSQNAIIVGIEQMHDLAAAYTRPDELMNKLAFAAGSNGHNRVEPATWMPTARVLVISDEQLSIMKTAHPSKTPAEVFDQAVEQMALERSVASPRYPMSPIRAALSRRAVAPIIIGQCEAAAALLASYPDARVRMAPNNKGQSTYVFVGDRDLGAFDAGVVDWLLSCNVICQSAGLGAMYTPNRGFAGQLSPEAQTAFKGVLDRGAQATLIHNDQGVILQYPGCTTLDPRTMRVPVPIFVDSAIVAELWRAGALKVISNVKGLFMAVPTASSVAVVAG